MGNKRVITQKEEQDVLYWYVEKRRGQLFTAKTVFGNTNIDWVKEILKKNGVKIRSYAEAATLSNQNRALGKNENYFSVESHNMAWLLGFIAADGYVAKSSNEIAIGLARVDREILEKIKREVNIERNIRDYTTSDGFDCSRLSWCCQQHKQDLAKYSIIPQKTFHLLPPTELQRQYWIDYIRGYFDGDGSVNIIKPANGRGNGALRWQIAGATKEVLEWIVNFLYEEYKIPKAPIYATNANRKHTLYYFQYSSKATRQIYNILYTPNALFLKRKKDHFKKILTQIKPQ